jgi:small subunit ribosomal protein S6
MENLYCTIFIVDISQNPDEVDTVSSRIQQLIEDHGGIIKILNPWGKRRLAYPIQKKNYGSYVEIEFTANSRLNIAKIIENEYRINDRVLRYLTYVVTKKELTQREIDASRAQKVDLDKTENDEKLEKGNTAIEDKRENKNDVEKSSDSENVEVADEDETKNSE